MCVIALHAHANKVYVCAPICFFLHMRSIHLYALASLVCVDMQQSSHAFLNEGHSNLTECSLCFEPTAFVGRGSCGHSEICWLCTIRLRWICRDLSCAICKADLSAGIDIGVSAGVEVVDGVRFRDPLVAAEASRLRAYMCVDCGYNFRSIRDLQTHLKRDHESFFCSVCLDHRQCFVGEQIVYRSASALAEHQKSDHASCEFCRGDKFYNIDELTTHMNQAHFKCLVCERLDYRNEYYSNYDTLNRHASEAHFPCEYPECKEQRFVVFQDEDELRLHWGERHGRTISFGNSASGHHTQKRYRNRNGSVYSCEVHFRGPKGGHTQTVGANRPENAYPDRLDGVVYNSRIHQAVARVKSSAIRLLIPKSVESHRMQNIAFMQKLESKLNKDQIGKLKEISTEYRTGKTSVADFLAVCGSLVSSDYVCELIALMPDEAKRQQVLSHLDKVPVEVKQVNTGKVKSREIPHNLWTLSGNVKKPCLINALSALLADCPSVDPPTQVVLHAMEGKINALDRIQLSTLSEMRHHLLTLDESGSWSNAEEVVSLRPLLYRLLSVPETHKLQTTQLVQSGWNEFYKIAHDVLYVKFSKKERTWMKIYVELSILRLANIGPLDVRKRTDFPPMLAQAPTPAPPPVHADFPSILPAVSTRTSSGWQNTTLSDDSFPQLAQAPATTISKTWNCPRCTFLNTRLLALSCEICGKERPPVEETPEPLSTNPLRPKKNKHKVILSSTTQRDYKR